MNGMRAWFRRRVPVDPDALRAFGAEPVPEHLKQWWWCLGGTAAYLFLVQVVTGILLAFHYVPEPSQAYESVQRITETVPYGWYLRSLHRWSSNFMIVAVLLHVLRVFFTGAYRAPREINWIIGCGLLFVTLMFGFTGYSLVYEQLSYWGATVAGNITEAVPLVGVPLADFIRGGETVGGSTLTRFFAFHIGVLPTAMLFLLFLHLALIRLLGVTEFKVKRSSGAAKTFPFFPDHFITEIGIGVTLMFLMTILAVVFPVGLEDKANALVTPAHIKPEWYFYFTFRWLKLTSLTFAILSLGFFGFMMVAWPFIDRFLQAKTKLREISILIGIVVFACFVVMTVWEALVLFHSH
jgi:quinol-cytochrome oxidoreductase complex cytochrome b subunit